MAKKRMMAKKITIDVTQEDIDNATHGGGASNCPVARALQRQGYPRASVSGDIWRTWNFIDEGREYDVEPHPIPSDTRERIYEYDRTGKMEPFSFETEVPE